MSNQIQPASAKRSSGSDWGKYLVILVFLALVVIPVGYYGFNSEFARWKAARAELLYDADEIEQSLELMQRSVEQAPHNQDLKLSFAYKLMRHGQAERALELIDEVIDYSTNPRESIEAKAQCLMYLGRAQESLTYIKSASDYLDTSQYQQPIRLNTMAYYRALAKKELVQANEDISKSIRMTQELTWWLDSRLPMSLADQTLLATAVVALGVDQSELAVGKLSERIDEMRLQNQQYQELVSREVYFLMSSDTSLDASRQSELKIQQYQMHAKQQFLAVLLVVRSFIHQETGKQRECDLDRLEIDALGFDADELLAGIPDDWQLMSIMTNGGQFLDTDAMVKIATGRKLEEAIAELDTSVLAFTVLSLTGQGSLRNTLRDESGQSFDERDIRHSEAVIRSHRAQAKIQLGLPIEAERDLQRIEELGFQRDEKLF